MNSPANPDPVVCKICQSPSPLFGVVDFSKSCLEGQGKRLNLIGVPVYYRRCTVCGFLFTTAFDSWTAEGFKQHIYNDDYIVVDPDYVEIRPTNNAKAVGDLFQAHRSVLNILDYGGGEGLFSRCLRERGFHAGTYDPFSAHHTEFPSGRYNLITSFEVMEHVPDPESTVATMVSMLQEGGVIFFSTLLQPGNIQEIGLNWWYAGPRNGHVSLYSPQALIRLFERHGMKVGSFTGGGTHIAYTEIPDFASHLKFFNWTF
jgi:2-polyprenyl-6-hydroxyphenyl methylase/3-demethylubiquinone-9 3-methyltransferase